MLELHRSTVFFVAVLVLLLSAACSSTHSPVAPTTPSTGASTVATGTTTVTGTITTSSSASSVGARGAAAGIVVSISGTTLTTTADANGRFTFTNTPAMEIVLKFEGAGVNATLSIGVVQPQERIEITVTVSGTTATLDSNQRTGGDSTVQAEGRIDDLDATPKRFLLSGAIVDAAGASIHRADGTPMTFADLRRGDHVTVRGVRNGTVIVASDVSDKNSAAPPVTFTGTIGAVAGGCPALTLTVSGVSGLSIGTRTTTVNVSTVAATTWTAKPCGEARIGDPVTVTALRQADDSLVATAVDARNPPPVQFAGVISSVSGGCPYVTLVLGSVSGLAAGTLNASVTVTTSAPTTWPTKACADVRSSDTASIVAMKQPDGTYLATSVDAKSPPVTNVTFSGTIGSIAGSCPVITLSMSNVSGLSLDARNYSATVVTNTGTAFPSNACGAVKSGDSVTITASKQSNGIYLASSVDAKTALTTFTGTIGNIAGTCPSLSFSMTGVVGLASVTVRCDTASVTTNSSTTFKTGCTSIKAGKTATVGGTKQADGSYAAVTVEVR